MISVSADASGRLTGQAYAPKGGETQCSGIIIHIGGPALTIQGAVAAVPRHGLDCLKSVRILPLASVHTINDNPTSNTTLRF